MLTLGKPPRCAWIPKHQNGKARRRGPTNSRRGYRRSHRPHRGRPHRPQRPHSGRPHRPHRGSKATRALMRKRIRARPTRGQASRLTGAGAHAQRRSLHCKQCKDGFRVPSDGFRVSLNGPTPKIVPSDEFGVPSDGFRVPSDGSALRRTGQSALLSKADRCLPNKG